MSDFINRWPNGLSEEVAVVDASIEYIEKKLNTSFNEDYNDLDSYKYCIFKFEKGYCALMRYSNAPIGGVTLMIEKDHLSKLDYFVNYFLEQLHLSDRRILWQRPWPD